MDIILHSSAPESRGYYVFHSDMISVDKHMCSQLCMDIDSLCAFWRMIGITVKCSLCQYIMAAMELHKE